MPEVAESFGEAAHGYLREVQSAIHAILDCIPGRPTRATDLAQLLNIEKTLAWKMFNLAEEADPLGIVSRLPGDAGFEIFCKAALRAGVAEPLVARAREAMRGVQHLTASHAGDRETLGMLLSNYQEPETQRALAVAHRKTAFKSSSFIWGVQARVQYKLSIASALDDPGLVSFATACGLIDFRRLRTQVAWTVNRRGMVDETGAERQGTRVMPIGTAGTPPDMSLLAPFCSSPLPAVVLKVAPGGRRDYQIPPGPVGNAEKITCLLGDHVRHAGPSVANRDNRYFASGSRLHTPVKLWQLDLLIHQDLFPHRTPEFAIYSELGGGPWPECGEHMRLPMAAVVEPLGQGPKALRSRDVPRAPEMARFVLERVGWPAEEFDAFRVKIEYPPIPTNAMLRYELPAGENA